MGPETEPQSFCDLILEMMSSLLLHPIGQKRVSPAHIHRCESHQDGDLGGGSVGSLEAMITKSRIGLGRAHGVTKGWTPV